MVIFTPVYVGQDRLSGTPVYVSRQEQDRNKTGTRQEQDRNKTGTRQEQDRNKAGTRQGPSQYNIVF